MSWLLYYLVIITQLANHLRHASQHDCVITSLEKL